jgi:hypothetical protein
MAIEGTLTSANSFNLITTNGTVIDSDPTPSQDGLLLESNFYLLFEDSGKILIKF